MNEQQALADFQNRFAAIKAQGYVRSMRRGPTGIGFTLETLLEIAENNSPLPDIVGRELKAHRTKSNSLITLFTFNRKAWQMSQLRAIQLYGTPDSSGRMGIYYTLRQTPNSAGLFTHVDDDTLSVRHISGNVIVSWQFDVLAAQFSKKIPALIFVSAFTEERNGVEYFHFYRAQHLEGTSPELLANQFKEENITIDLRLHDAGTKARNHGIGFRTFEANLPRLFEKVTEL